MVSHRSTACPRNCLITFPRTVLDVSLPSPWPDSGMAAGTVSFNWSFFMLCSACTKATKKSNDNLVLTSTGTILLEKEIKLSSSLKTAWQIHTDRRGTRHPVYESQR